LLYIAAKLGVADVLADGPLASGALAQQVGAEPEAFHRVLRGLAADGVLDERPDGRFGLTELGAVLRSGLPGSLRGAIIARGDLYSRAAGGLLDAVRSGGVAFDRVYGSSVFEYLSRHPGPAADFQDSMTDRSCQEAAGVLAAYDFARFDRIVDVGGGTGVLLAAILASAPHLRGILFDRPEMVERARRYLGETAAVDRCEFVAGDFFKTLPRGGDAYLLSRIIHDWDDEAAGRILATCHRAMNPGARLLLVETILPEFAREHPAAIRMDLHMLLLLTGRERTESEFDRLLTAAGFRMTRVIPTTSAAGVNLIEAIKP
jgi:ubiquinone/menaquinone biosynthesis C-methylase UbiE